ncbi:MAG TPA: penicillin-binding transpeptidase domain-containing protein [Verrucomicrobiae bacterium]|nr:penicillin-binding transpeptidase domain-containing protein [Verrucomicrobiae bacterium]
MLIFDELKKNDPQLRLVAMAVAGGLGILLAGLWWVQIASAHEYQNNLETQTYRTVRLPAARGEILDREGRVLAENRPRYDLSLFLDDLQDRFDAAYRQLHEQAIAEQTRTIATREKELGRSLTKTERKQFAFSDAQLEQMRQQARDAVANSVVAQIGQELGLPLTLDEKKFEFAYREQRALPYNIVQDANAVQVARFEEQNPGTNGAALNIQPVRVYPNGDLASHVLGYVTRDDSSVVGEDAFFNYRLPDYRGVVGIEGGYDAYLRGRAGEESLLVNSLGYRQSETVWTPPEPGRNVVLTIDLDVQRAAQESLLTHQGPDARAAIVVMDVNSGDVLAMVSSPAFDPNDFVNGFTPAEWQRLNDTNLDVQLNRATQENYAPGSIFKPVVALAALEDGLDPNATVHNPGYVMVGRRHIGDLAPPGEYDLKHAIIYSCNTYFVTIGLRAGITNIIRMAEKFHFGERTALKTRQETSGILPTLSQVTQPDWLAGDSANICIGQGDLAVTPLQMAVAYAAIANGGKVLWPRLVERIEPEDPDSGEAPTVFPSGIVRDELDVKPANLNILRKAMLAETEDPEGTGHAAVVGPAMEICGKTGTAQVMDAHNREIGRTTWFASFAPYDHPRYAVVVMVENGTYGGPTCAPIAHDIYEELLKKDEASGQTLAKAN